MGWNHLYMLDIGAENAFACGGRGGVAVWKAGMASGKLSKVEDIPIAAEHKVQCLAVSEHYVAICSGNL